MYDCDCEDCKTQRLNLANGNNAPKCKRVLNAVEKAFKQLHEKGNYSYKDLENTKEYKALLKETNNVLQSGITDNDIPPEMRNSLQQDVFVFSGLKTHAQLLEASQQLLMPEGKVKSFTQFSQDVERIKSNYNQTYLEAEYQFAITSSQMAGKWAQADNDRYNLQYRTAGDDKVRASHAALDKITLPASDDFWLSYYPPNGWRCRCNAVQVRKSKYEVSDSKIAITAGEKATQQLDKDGKNKLEIFRFNPGKQKVIFPPKHPYHKIKDYDKVKESINNIEHVPEGLKNYESKLKVSVDKSVFKYLSRPTDLVDHNKKGAFYSPSGDFVNIPIDTRRKRSSWYSKAVVYHEFGHAADWHNGYRTSKLTKDTMDKHRALLGKNRNTKYKEVHTELNQRISKSHFEKDYNTTEKLVAISDTVMALNINYGTGHSKSYFKRPLMPEAEFIAHAFENKFAKNEIFKELLPELYEDMIKLVEDFETMKK